MGALEYVPANGPESRNENIDVTEMVKLASEILQGKEECFAYKPDNRWISSHQMSVNGKTRGLTEQDLIESGVSMGIGRTKCKQIIAKAKEVVSLWPLYAEKSGISEKWTAELEQAIRENGLIKVS